MVSFRTGRKLKKLLKRFDKIRSRAGKELQKAESKRIEARKEFRLENTSIAALNKLSAGNIRLGALRSAGINSIADVKAKRRLIPRLRGIGPQSVSRINTALVELLKTTSEDSVLPADASKWTEEDHAYVETLMWNEDIERANELGGPVDNARSALKSGGHPNFLKSIFSKNTSDDVDSGTLSQQRIEDLIKVLEPLIDAVERDQWRAIYGPGITVERWEKDSARLLTFAETKAVNAPLEGDFRGGDAALLPQELVAQIEAMTLNMQGFKRPLRKYQDFGARFVISTKGAILGDEMGLGKTVEALAVAHHLSRSVEKFRGIVVAPASLLENWRRETIECTDIEPIVLHGINRNPGMARWNSEGGIGIVSYQSLRSIGSSFIEDPNLVIVDEAHKIKNPVALQTMATKSLIGQSEFSLLLTGTPLENKTKEFIFLSGIVNANIGNQLNEIFGDGDAAHLSAIEFRRLIAPCYLRRNQLEVLKELPELQVINERVELNGAELENYQRTVAQEKIPAIRLSTTIGIGLESSKILRLKEILEDYQEMGKKVLVFSFFLGVLDAVEQVVGSEVLRLDGSLSPVARQQIVDDFNSREGFAVLVMQIDAGGVGLNLQKASAVVIMEPQFKPSTENQAIKRAHRMGQTNTVTVHRLLANGTIDERLEDRLQTKELLFDVIARPSTMADASMNSRETEFISDSDLLSAERAIVSQL